MEHKLDTLDLLCPLPVLKAHKRLSLLKKGDFLEILANDPAAIIDVPHFCAEAGHALIDTREQDGIQIYVIRKGS